MFPFAAYEAKGWSGDPREARRQACSAGSVYLDMLDRLSKIPGKPGDLDGAYQAEDSRNSQVFVFTSFGAHWHILVGYRRPRLAREHAGMAGMSKTVYVSTMHILDCHRTNTRFYRTFKEYGADGCQLSAKRGSCCP